MPAPADGLEEALRAAGSPARAEHERRCLKSSLEHFGASVPGIRKVAKSAGRLERAELLAQLDRWAGDEDF